MRLRLVLIGVVLFLTSGAWSQSTPICYTHFNNQSDFQWNITNADGRNTTIFIPPHTKATIGWGTTTGVIIGANIPNKPYRQQFSVQEGSSSVVIQPKGPDAMIMLNQPGGGDVMTCTGGC